MLPSIWMSSQLLGVPDVVDPDLVVVRAPEEGDGFEPLPGAQDIAGGDLSLALGDDPVLDADRHPGMRIGPARNVAGGKDIGRTGLEVFVDYDAAIDREFGLLRELEPRPHTDPDNDEVGRQPGPIVEYNGIRVYPPGAATEVEDDAVSFVEAAQHRANFRAEDVLQWDGVRGNHVDVDVADAERGSGLEPNEAGSNDYGVLCVWECRDNGARLAERSGAGGRAASRRRGW